jgi:hypothetical protein
MYCPKNDQIFLCSNYIADLIFDIKEWKTNAPWPKQTKSSGLEKKFLRRTEESHIYANSSSTFPSIPSCSWAAFRSATSGFLFLLMIWDNLGSPIPNSLANSFCFSLRSYILSSISPSSVFGAGIL